MWDHSLAPSAPVQPSSASLPDSVRWSATDSGLFRGTSRTRRTDWTVTFVGYAINMLALPSLALAGNWPLTASLIVAERTGRAIRRPAVESMLSQAGESIGQGWVFDLNEALDQIGATLGPLIRPVSSRKLSTCSRDIRDFSLALFDGSICCILPSQTPRWPPAHWLPWSLESRWTNWAASLILRLWHSSILRAVGLPAFGRARTHGDDSLGRGNGSAGLLP